MKITTILDMVELASIALPVFQRGYVWNREQVRGLLQSLYRKYPIGSLLVWETRVDGARIRGDGPASSGTIHLLLDGQQRITTLYGIVRGRPPRLFDGNAQIFTGLYFHLDDEAFEFYAPQKMKDNPLWVNITELLQRGSGATIQRLFTVPELQARFSTYVNRLNAIDAIKNVDLHVEQISGEDKTVDIVVDIFNRVNSGGTKLSKADLALAKVCALWPEARDEMKARLARWQRAGFDFKLDWLLRNVVAVRTGQAMFSGLEHVTTDAFRDGLGQAERACDAILNMISGRLGLDHDRVLAGRYAFPVMTRYLVQQGGRLTDSLERDRLLFWYVHAFLWGRYAGSTETAMNQDLRLIAEHDGGLERLIDQLRLSRGHLHVRPEDFAGHSLGARFYPLLYLLTRVGGARDWGTGLPLSAHLLGRLSALQVHHVFPQAVLKVAGYSPSEINALANFCFLTQESNLLIGAQQPDTYFPVVERNHPGTLASQWIPVDPALWQVNRYRDFLAARRAFLAEAANRFLDQLNSGELPDVVPAVDVTQREITRPLGGIPGTDQEEQILDCLAWVEEKGLPDPELLYELADTASGATLAILDLAWPNGLQEGLSEPVALLLNESAETEAIVNRVGYRFFTSVEDLKRYVLTAILAEHAAAA